MFIQERKPRWSPAHRQGWGKPLPVVLSEGYGLRCCPQLGKMDDLASLGAQCLQMDLSRQDDRLAVVNTILSQTGGSMYWSIMPVLACMARSKRSASMRLATSLRSISSARRISRNYCFPRCAPAVADILSISLLWAGRCIASSAHGTTPPNMHLRVVRLPAAGSCRLRHQGGYHRTRSD